MIGPFADDRLQPHRLQIFLGVRLDVQHDVGAGVLALRRRQGELAGAFGRPGEGLFGAGFAGGDFDPVGDHERRVEPDAELADQARPVLGLRGRQVLREGAWCRSGRWCRGCRSFPGATCRCRRRRSAASWPACRARCGSSPRPGAPGWDRSAPRTGGDRWRRRHWPPVRAGRFRAPSRGSGPRDPAGGRPRRQMHVVPTSYRSSGPPWRSSQTPPYALGTARVQCVGASDRAIPAPQPCVADSPSGCAAAPLLSRRSDPPERGSAGHRRPDRGRH